VEAGNVIDFAKPVYLALGLVVLAMAAGVFYIGVWRARARAEFAGPQSSRWGGSGFWLRGLFVVFAAGLIALAAARPQWGTTATVREREGIDYVIALDISKSMSATDVEPTRLEAAQDELVRLVQSERGDRIGLVLFAGSAFLRSPLTSDTQAMAQLIRRAGGEASLARSGSDLGAALDVARVILGAGEPDRGQAVILVSDGEDFADTYAARARSLAQRGITVLTAGVGTEAGSQLYEEDFAGNVSAKLDQNGQPVISRLNESTLKQIAEITGGRYARVTGDPRSLSSLEVELRSLDPTPAGSERSIIPIERYQPFVAAALVLLLVAWFLPARLPLPRLRRAHPAFAVVLLALVVAACGGSNEDSLRARNQEANDLFAAGDYQGALDIYQELLAQRPDVDELSYNAGNALHRLQSYERAVSATSRALPPRDVQLGVDTYYALGNHLLFLGRLEEAYVAYRNALLLDPTDADSKYNLEVVLRLALAQEQPSAQQQPDQATPEGSQPGGEPAEDGTPIPGGGEGTPGAGDQGTPSPEGQPGSSPQAGSPVPGDAGSSDVPGTPEGTPETAASIDRSLAEALAGIEDEVSFEEAIEILDLLRQRQQTAPPVPGGPSFGPDY
jgi:Ca-activated chloride channel family protein